MDLSIFKRVIPLWCWPGGCSSFRTSSLPSPSQRRSRFLCCCNPESYPSQRSSKQNKIFEQFWSQLGLKQKRIWFDLGVSIKAGTTGVVAAARTCNFHLCQKVLFGSGRTSSKHFRTNYGGESSQKYYYQSNPPKSSQHKPVVEGHPPRLFSWHQFPIQQLFSSMPMSQKSCFCQHFNDHCFDWIKCPRCN